MSQSGGLAVYVTSHGFGHLNRTVAVLNQIPEDVPVIIRGHPNLFDHWRERLKRFATLEAHVSDAGAVNPPGNSAETDGPASLALAARVHAEALGRVAEEADRLQAEKTAAVLCDAPPLPLVSARRAGVPGFLMTNFTWADIYAPYARKLGGEWPGFVRELRRAYRAASALFRLGPGLPMEGVAPTIDVGMVVTPGQSRKAELFERLGLETRSRLVYLYLGRYGQDSLDWSRIARLGSAQIHFVGFHGVPESVEAPKNLHVLPALNWTGADLAASTDVVVAKAGYGTVCEAMVAGTPMIYPPRVGFAEHKALVWALTTWGGGLQAPRRSFDRLRIDAQLRKALTLRPGPPPFPTDGADRVARILTKICRTGNAQSWQKTLNFNIS